MASYVCDLCGWQSDDRAATLYLVRGARLTRRAGSATPWAGLHCNVAGVATVFGPRKRATEGQP